MSILHPKKKVLVSLHGIRTRGEWQKELCPLVSEKGWKYYPLDYGYFTAPQLAIAATHKSKIKWFRDKMNDIYAENPDALPSIIVHSFGSLILAKALKRLPDLKFDRVILTGSIIPVDYPWPALVENEQISFVRNLVGKADCWSKIASFLPWTGAGNSGAKGFNNQKYDHFLEDIVYDEMGHGDTHYPDVFKARVVPFLEDPSIRSNCPKANYLTYVDPFHAACWSAVMYIRQYVERFYISIRSNDFYYRDEATPPKYDQLKEPPKGLVVVIPDEPTGASAISRDCFDLKWNLKSIVFSSKARGASFSEKDSLIYDIPSAIESLSVYTEVTGDGDSARVALRMFGEVLAHSLALKYGTDEHAPKVLNIKDMEEK